MIKPSLVATLLLLGLAPAAISHAQSPSPSVAANARTLPETTVPGVTVTGRRLKPCDQRDQACIDSVSQEIWTRYPKQIETMCTYQQIHMMQQGFQQEQLGLDTTEINTRMTPQTQALCEYGAKMKKIAAEKGKDAPAPNADAPPTDAPRPAQGRTDAAQAGAPR